MYSVISSLRLFPFNLFYGGFWGTEILNHGTVYFVSVSLMVRTLGDLFVKDVP